MNQKGEAFTSLPGFENALGILVPGLAIPSPRAVSVGRAAPLDHAIARRTVSQLNLFSL